MTYFKTDYAALDADKSLGEVALLPWDAAIFGFGVGDYRLPTDTSGIETGALRSALERWAGARRVELISATAPFADRDRGALLDAAGFRLVDVSLRVSNPRLGSTTLPAARTSVRQAREADLPQLEPIAASAFRFGRYHADPRFPLPLANDRFRQWIVNAVRSKDTVFVQEVAVTIRGFLHVRVDGKSADLRLGAVDPETDDPFSGPDLYADSLHALRLRGVTRATARVPAANVSALNLYASLGFRFDAPDAVYHWRPSCRP
jgi:ribosomal protein S18 acetylase RimI-like enzyme